MSELAKRCLGWAILAVLVLAWAVPYIGWCGVYWHLKWVGIALVSVVLFLIGVSLAKS